MSATVLELAEMIWRKVHGPTLLFTHVSDEAHRYDVRYRVPAVDKAKRLPGFEATTRLDDVLDEVIPWVNEQIARGTI